MAKRNVVFSVIFVALLLGNLAYAAPGIPNRFYGYVNFINGPAPDGTIVEAKINGITVSSTTTVSGKYGYAPNIFDVTDPDNNRAGKTISFFVSGVDTGETAVFTNGKSKEKKEQNTPAMQENNAKMQEETKQPYAPTGLFASAAANSSIVVGAVLIIIAAVWIVRKKSLQAR